MPLIPADSPNRMNQLARKQQQEAQGSEAAAGASTPCHSQPVPQRQPAIASSYDRCTKDFIPQPIQLTPTHCKSYAEKSSDHNVIWLI
jgi:hypothetical protein